MHSPSGCSPVGRTPSRPGAMPGTGGSGGPDRARQGGGRRYHRGQRRARAAGGHRRPGGRPDMHATSCGRMALRAGSHQCAGSADRGQAGELPVARARQVRPHARRLLPRAGRGQCLDGARGPCLGLHQVFDELRRGRGRSARPTRGHLAGRGDPAWEYRAQHWAKAEPEAPQGCAIKGNVTQHGKIYHMPWSPWYAQIKMDPDRGRRWFCTEAEAVAAGWRPVNLR